MPVHIYKQGQIQGGGGGATPLKLKKKKKIGVKSSFFTRNTKKKIAPPSALRNFFKCTAPDKSKVNFQVESWEVPSFCANPLLPETRDK